MRENSNQAAQTPPVRMLYQVAKRANVEIKRTSEPNYECEKMKRKKEIQTSLLTPNPMHDR